MQMDYYQFYLTPKGATKQQVSLCDVAGEVFNINDEGTSITQKGFRYGNAFMLIIDPLSISEYRKELEAAKTINLNEYKGCAQNIDEMLDTFLRNLRNMLGKKEDALVNTHIAAVFTKVDIPGLSKKIGETVVLSKATSKDTEAKNKIRNEICRKFLADYHEHNFLNLLDKFKNVQFFACSALGHVRDGSAFKASNVEEPLLWLLGKQSSVIEKATKNKL
jgi:hypothetical protein